LNSKSLSNFIIMFGVIVLFQYALSYFFHPAQTAKAPTPIQASVVKTLPAGLVLQAPESSAKFGDALGELKAAFASVPDQRNQHFNKAVQILQELTKSAGDSTRDGLTATLEVTYIQWHFLNQDLQAATELSNMQLLHLSATQDVSVWTGHAWANQPAIATIDKLYTDVADAINRGNEGKFAFKFIGFFVMLCHWAGPYKEALALVVLGTMVTLLLTPIRNWQYKTMGRVARMQPDMKKIQEQYKGQPEEMNRRMMALYKEHGTNPMMGCLPMLVQIPFMWWLYYAIRSYQFMFHGSFFWIGSHFAATHTMIATPKGPIFALSLAHSDLPLLILYTVSMYLYSKFMPVTSTDPEQMKQSQRMSVMMSLMMPVMFYFYNWPSAFILWWLAMNVTQTLLTVFYLQHHPDLQALYHPQSQTVSAPGASKQASPSRPGDGARSGATNPATAAGITGSVASADPTQGDGSESTGDDSTRGTRPTGPRRIEPHNRRKTRSKRF
jgi:YidC/Oxa1 family membrane protein insertase